jgi:predicted nucleic acid-binding protein
VPVLDATFLIDVRARKHGAPAALERMASSPERILVPAQVAVEYGAGLLDIAQGFRELAESFEVVPFDEAIAREAARLAQGAIRRGKFPGWGDTQVAATAAYHGMWIASTNVKHLRDALGARVWDYRREADPPA